MAGSAEVPLADGMRPHDSEALLAQRLAKNQLPACPATSGTPRLAHA